MAITRDGAVALMGGELGARRFVGCATVQAGPVQRAVLTTDQGSEVPALYIPPARSPAPAVLYCHAHGRRYDIGMAELTDGRPALGAPYGPALAAAGFAVLCLEMPCFGARAGMDEDATAKARLWHGRTLFGQMLAEQAAGLDWLAARPEVDARRIGAMGISMGGTLAWWLAALDPRVACAAALCCFADMAALIETGAHDGHGTYMTVPGLLARARTGQVAGLAAPRPLFFGIGLRDWSTPPAAFAIARADVETAYAAAGAAGRATFHVEPDLGHSDTPAMREATLAFLARSLPAQPLAQD